MTEKMANKAIYKLVFSDHQEYMTSNDLVALMKQAGRSAKNMTGVVRWAIYHCSGRCVACGTSKNKRSLTA